MTSVGRVEIPAYARFRASAKRNASWEQRAILSIEAKPDPIPLTIITESIPFEMDLCFSFPYFLLVDGEAKNLESWVKSTVLNESPAKNGLITNLYYDDAANKKDYDDLVVTILVLPDLEAPIVSDFEKLKLRERM